MRSWFITGVSSGLGRALAEAVLVRGDRVTGTVRDESAARAFTEQAPDRARAVLLDVIDRDAVTRVVAEAEAATGAVDVLVSNAGYSLEGTVEATDFADIEAQFATHVFASIALIKAVLPGMRGRRSGHILTLGSLAAHTPNGGTAVYAAAKAAIETLSAGLAREVEPFGIRVTALVPGAFRTRLGDSRRGAAATIPDYADADKARRERLAGFSGTQRGDPRKAAEAIIAIVNAPDTPLRFALGPDALAGLRTHAAALLADADASEGPGGATDFAAEELAGNTH